MVVRTDVKEVYEHGGRRTIWQCIITCPECIRAEGMIMRSGLIKDADALF